MADSQKYVEVALLLPIAKTFVYEVPQEWQEEAGPGKRVLVPLGKRLQIGYILGPAFIIPKEKEILPLREIFADDFIISEKFLRFLLWTARYYFQPIGEVIKAALPPGIHPQIKETYELTAQGQQALLNSSLAPLEKKILLSLQNGEKPLKIKGFSRKIIRQMIAAGWIEKKETLGQQRTKEKKALFLHYLGKSAEPSLTLAQKEALNFLREVGEVALEEFKAKFRNYSSLIKKFKKNNLIEVLEKETFRQISWAEATEWKPDPPAQLTRSQEKAIAEISRALENKKFQPFLLHGVTGSGKTEVYLRIIEKAIVEGGQALLLVPEINLTSQVIAYFRARSHYEVALLHSGLTPRERFDEWRRIKRGLAKLVIGARSGIFAPLEKLSLLIIDEEHDPAYKQEDKVLYNARDLALVRGRMENAVVVLGSATPSLESYYNVQQKKFRYLSLPERIDGRPLPEVQIVDLRRERVGLNIFSKILEESLLENIAKNEQALLFLNRRGFATFGLCPDCGFTFKCPNCSVSLIYHLEKKIFCCHYCEYALPAPAFCPQCSSVRLLLLGTGTERLEEEIKKKFPHALVGRMDRDTANRRKSYKIIDQVRRGEVNLLVGTQMITKGYDLPGVTLVGVLAADLSLNIPDFRASERTFQLLTQVAGRAGRGALPGKVIIQTYNPDHYSLTLAQAQDFLAFYEQEAFFRRKAGYPPFSRLVRFRLEGNSLEKVEKYAQALEQLILKIKKKEKKYQDQIELLGPSPAPLFRLKGKYRFHLLLKSKNWARLHDFVDELLRKQEEISLPKVRLIVEVDPVNML